MALSTRTSVKTHLGIPQSDTTEDNALDQWLAGASALIKRYLGGQQLEQATYTEYYQGLGTNQLRLRQRPVISITSIYLDTDGYYGQGTTPYPAATLLTAGLDYALVPDQPDGTSSRSGIVERLNGTWPAGWKRTRGMLGAAITPGLGNLKITYVAGYATIPADIELATNKLVALIRREAQAGAALTGENYSDGGSYSYSVNPPANWTEAIAGELSGYKAMGW